MSSTRKNGLLKRINTNSSNYTISNSIDDYSKTENNEIYSTSKKNYKKSKIKSFKTFFNKFGKINNSFNESFKYNSIYSQNILNNTVKSRYN